MAKVGRVGALVGMLVLVGSLGMGASQAATIAAWAADPAFYALWARADGPVAAGRAGRSWLWGPAAVRRRQRAVGQSPSGTRLVQYFDKARMEVDRPGAGLRQPLLRHQRPAGGRDGHGPDPDGRPAPFQAHAAADVAVAGDGHDPAAPTYASFAPLLGRPRPPGRSPSALSRGGTLAPVAPAGPADAAAPATTDPVTQHSIPPSSGRG